MTTDDLLIPVSGSRATAGLVRTLTDQRLRKWDCIHILDDALLIVTELITNAAEETPHQEIRFRLARDARGVLIAVWDASPRLPRTKPLVELTLDTLDLAEENLDDNGGRGLHLVRALAVACGCTRVPDGGKWVWARLVP